MRLFFLLCSIVINALVVLYAYLWCSLCFGSLCSPKMVETPHIPALTHLKSSSNLVSHIPFATRHSVLVINSLCVLNAKIPGSVHPGDLKPSVQKAVDDVLTRISQHGLTDPAVAKAQATLKNFLKQQEKKAKTQQ
jgi:hypothetical protein